MSEYEELLVAREKLLAALNRLTWHNAMLSRALRLIAERSRRSETPAEYVGYVLGVLDAVAPVVSNTIPDYGQPEASGAAVNASDPAAPAGYADLSSLDAGD